MEQNQILMQKKELLRKTSITITPSVHREVFTTRKNRQSFSDRLEELVILALEIEKQNEPGRIRTCHDSKVVYFYVEDKYRSGKYNRYVFIAELEEK